MEDVTFKFQFEELVDNLWKDKEKVHFEVKGIARINNKPKQYHGSSKCHVIPGNSESF